MLQRWWDALRQRIGWGSSAGSTDAASAGTTAPRDYEAERDEARRSHMSAEDRAWEAASRQRDQATHEPGATSADPAKSPERQGH